jgi:hypothetical protein
MEVNEVDKRDSSERLKVKRRRGKKRKEGTRVIVEETAMQRQTSE